MTKAVRLLVLAAAVSMLGACDRHAADRRAEGSTTSQPPVPSAELSADAAREGAVSAYRAMWAEFVAAGATSDWGAPGLRSHATGTALQKLTSSLRSDQEKGLVTKGSPTLNPEASTVDPLRDPRKVTVKDCGDSTTSLKYRKDNGLPVDGAQGGKRFIVAVVERQPDETWKVSDFGVDDLGTCK